VALNKFNFATSNANKTEQESNYLYIARTGQGLAKHEYSCPVNNVNVGYSV